MDIKTYDEIFDSMKNNFLSKQTKITDLNDGSVISSFIEAAAREIALLYVRAKLGFVQQLQTMPYSVFGFDQKAGTKASCNVIFSRAAAASYQTTIPSGTAVAAGSLVFYTTAAATIEANAVDSAPVAASAAEIGSDYNVAAYMISAISSVVPEDVKKVKNVAAATGGTDAETFSDFAARFSDWVKGLQGTNYYGLKSKLTATDIVRSFSVVEHFPPKDGFWNATIYAEDGTGSLTPSEMEQVKALIVGDDDNEGVKPAGLEWDFDTPEIIPVSVSATLHVPIDVLNERDESMVKTEAQDCIQGVIDAKQIGSPLALADLTVALKSDLSYLKEVVITSPASKVECGDDEILRFSGAALTVVIDGQ